MRKEYAIRLPTGAIWTPERQLANPTLWQQALMSAKGAGHPAQCLCRDKGERPLYYTTRNRWLCLARFPDSGHLHRTDCRFYAPAAEASGLGVYAESAVKENKDGGKSIHLSFSLGRKLGGPPIHPTNTGPQPVRRPRSASRMTALGLLHLLWTEANLHVWHPNMAGRRSWAAVRRAITTTAASISQTRHRLDERLVVIPAQPGPNLLRDATVDLHTKTQWSHQSSQWIEQLILIGELRALIRGEKATVVRLHRDQDCRLTLFCQHALAAAWETRFPEIQRFLAATKSDVRLIALLVGETRLTDQKVVGNIHSGAFMPTTAEFIPFASSYEYRVARKLVDERRWFEKPLRFDAAADVLFPDFLLLDTAYPHYPMEVYGRMNDPDYLRHREQKNVLYDRLYGAGRHWQWVVDPQHKDAIPPLPPLSMKEMGGTNT